MRKLTILAALALWTGQDHTGRQARELVEKLRSEKIQEREEAARQLRDLGGSARPILEMAASDLDAEVAARARRLLEIISIDLSVTPKLRRVRPDIADRILAKDAAICTQAFMEALDKKKHPDVGKEDLAPLAILALRGSRVEQTPGPYGETRLWHQAYGEAGEVSRAIVEFDLRSAIPAVQDMLEGKHYLGAFLALETLARLKAIEAAPVILLLLRGPHSGIGECRGCRAAEVLKEFESRHLIPEVQELVGDEKSSARIHAAEALALLAPQRAVPSAIVLLKDRDMDVRQFALDVLGRLKAREAIPDVEELLKDPEQWVRYEAAKALAALGATDSGPAIAKLLKEPEKMLRSRALTSLGELRIKSLTPEVEKYLDDSEREVREAAVVALTNCEARECVHRLVRMLKGEDYWIREEIVRALVCLEATSEIPELLEIFRDTEPCKWSTCHWMSAGEALLRLDTKVVVREGSKHLLNPSRQLQRRVFELFARLDPKAAVPEITKLMEEGDPGLRVPLAKLLSRLGSPAGVSVLVRAASEGRSGLGDLNALRRPDGWKRLSRELPLIEFGVDAKSGKPLTIARPFLRGSRESLWQELGTISDLPIALPHRKAEKEGFSSEVLEITNDQGWTTLADVLQESLGRYDFVLEADRIQILPGEESLKFWNTWMVEREVKK